MHKKTVFRLFILMMLFGALIQPAAARESHQGGNPFFKAWTTPFRVPPFEKIKNSHFLPAFKEGIRREQIEIDAILASKAAPTFANTILPLDNSGIFITELEAIFRSLLDAETNDELQRIAQQVEPLLAEHRDNITLNEKLFARVKAVYDQRDRLSLSTEERFQLELRYRHFIRNGALLDPKQKFKLREINQQLALLTLDFAKKVLAEDNRSRIVINNPADWIGLPPAVVAMGAETAKQLGLEDKWVYTVKVPSMTPFLQYSQKRELREQLHRLYFTRGDRDDELDNKENARRLANLRIVRARLLGYPSHADFVLEERMAKNPATVNAFLKQLWTPALKRAQNEAADLQSLIDKEKGNFQLASWDWWFYAEKLRQQKYAFDDTVLRPYFSLENIRQGIFTLCDKLWGLKFIPLKNMPVYHPEVEVYEAREADGRHLGVLYMDFHPRPGKRGGAWSGTLRDAYYQNGKRQAPISFLVCNFTRPTVDAPALLSIDEVTTFFHEFGHSLRALLDDGRLRGRDGDIAWDIVELPSQIMENWALEPELLDLYARHYQTGQPIPTELVAKLKQAGLFNQGFETTEFLAAAILDMAWHSLTAVCDYDVRQFEKGVMEFIGLIPSIVSRYRTTYFKHIFSGGYSAGYYSYYWAGVLDKDAYEAFKEKGIFDKATAAAFRANILEKLGTEDPAELYRRFRGADPKIEPFLKSKGLIEE